MRDGSVLLVGIRRGRVPVVAGGRVDVVAEWAVGRTARHRSGRRGVRVQQRRLRMADRDGIATG